MQPARERLSVRPPSPPPAVSERSVIDDIERWTKMAIGAFGFLYVLGFLVHTLYLASYGVAAMNLLRIQYIMAGVWALMPMALIIGSYLWVMNVVESTRKETKPRPESHYLLVIGMALLGFIGVIGLAISPFAEIFTQPQNVSTIDLLWTIGLVVLLIVLVLGIAKEIKRHASIGWIVTLLAIVFVGYVVRFSRLVYPGIPASIGGGRPINVRFAISDEMKRVIPIDNARTYPLLMTTERTYTVLDHGRPVEISRDAVKAIIYEMPKH